MKPDKDKPRTWVRYRTGMCTGCYGSCCTMPVEVRASDLVRLGVAHPDEVETSVKKLVKRLKKEQLIQSYRESTELFTLAARPNGDCHFLHPVTRLCTKYEDRPDVCRQFPDIGPRPGFCPVSK